MTKYKYGNPEAPIVLIQPVGDHDLPEIEGEVAQIRKLTRWMTGTSICLRGDHRRCSEKRTLAGAQPRC